jgi:hypothetical protein
VTIVRRLHPGDDPVTAGLFAALPITAQDVLATAETPFALEFGHTADQLAGRITHPPGEPGTWTLRVRDSYASAITAIETRKPARRCNAGIRVPCPTGASPGNARTHSSLKVSNSAGSRSDQFAQTTFSSELPAP